MKSLILFEVFIRAQHVTGHQHVGSLMAAHQQEALLKARDLYTRREEGVSIWVVHSNAILASEPHDQEALFNSPKDKPFRYPTFYSIPDGVENL